MSFLFPPRPEKAVAPDLIPFYERRGWVAQLKKNGTCSCVRVDADGSTQFWTRHGVDHKAWTPTKEVSDFFSVFRDSYFVFELLHSKGPDVKDTAYVFDVVRYCGEDMVGKTFTERMNLLQSVVPLTDKVLIAKTHHTCLRGLYESLNSDLDEGIVLKDPDSKLEPCLRDSQNTGWQVKCRRGTKNYSS